MRLDTAAALAALALAIGCAPARAPQQPAAFDDPFAYCAAVGTADAPDASYRGEAVPDSIALGLRRAVGAPDAPLSAFAHSNWRCMNGAVYACTVGANLPCGEKADTSRTPSAEMAAFCREHPDSPFIPAAVTGRATVYAWRCTRGVATVERQIAQPDARGFIGDVWYPLPPP